MSVRRLFETSVEIPMDEYKELIRQSERLSVLENYLKSDGYKYVEQVEILLGLKKENIDETMGVFEIEQC